jgi:hypothetical protein
VSALVGEAEAFEGGTSIGVDFAAHEQPLPNRKLVSVAKLDRNTAALARSGYPNEYENPFCVYVKQPFRLESDRAAPGAAIDPAHKLVGASQHWGVGVQAREVEFKVWGNTLEGSAKVAPLQRLISASHELHVLPRHRPASIPASIA